MCECVSVNVCEGEMCVISESVCDSVCEMCVRVCNVCESGSVCENVCQCKCV